MIQLIFYFKHPDIKWLKYKTSTSYHLTCKYKFGTKNNVRQMIYWLFTKKLYLLQ